MDKSTRQTVRGVELFDPPSSTTPDANGLGSAVRVRVGTFASCTNSAPTEV